MDDSDTLPTHVVTPTATRPLLGLTILVVEDSRYACDAIRLMCLRSGARIRRADCLGSARRHLKLYRPSVMIVDMGLPDGSGAILIEEMSRISPRVPVILGMSGDDFAEDEAVAAGADGFLAKPLASLAVFQTAILSRLPPDRRPGGLRTVQDETIRPDPLTYQEDIAHIADVLSADADGPTLDYVAQFTGGLARSADDPMLAEAAARLAQARARGAPVGAEAARLAGLIQSRLKLPQAI